MMKRLICVLLGFVLLGGTNRMLAAVYHVSKNGNDAARGSNASPWRTLAKANREAAAGDVVMVHAGQFSDGICPLNSGQPNNPITFQAVQGERVVLRTTTGVHLGSNSKHIVIGGFEVYATYRMAQLRGSSYITIRNCKFFGGRGNYSAFSLENVSYCVIKDNYLNRQDPDDWTKSGDNPGGGDGLRLIGGSHHNLIEGNTVTRCEHVGFASSFSNSQVYQHHNVWRNNTSFNNHTNYSLQDGVQRCVFENNRSYYPGLVWKGGNGNGLQFSGIDCIIRFNTVYDDTGTVHTGRRWPALIGTGSGNGGSSSMEYNKIYNNTVYGETDQQGWKKAGWRIDNNRAGLHQRENIFKNNIFARANAAQVDDIDVTSKLQGMSNQYHGNLLCGAKQNAATIRYQYKGGSVVWQLADAIRNKPQQWSTSNKEGDPRFVNTVRQGASKDFGLREGSPAIDAAVNLTTAKGSGQMTARMAVADAGYFTDGWGIPGVGGDSIRIDGGPPVGITSVDYATNTFTLSDARSWNTGARVYYFRSDRFQGNAPDIGAHEFGVVPAVSGLPGIPLLVAPGDGAVYSSASVSFNWDPVPGAVSYRVQIACDTSFAAPVTDQAGVSQTSFMATGLTPGTAHHWRVAACNGLGTSAWSDYSSFTITGVTEASSAMSTSPHVYALLQNYPNPFNPSTTIRYSLASAGHVSLKVYNVLGQQIASLADEQQPAGTHEMRFDASGLPSGTYFYRIQTIAFEATKKMQVIK